MLNWATGLIEKGGYLGVAFAMFLENVFPPLPSELIMLFAGASAEQGDLSLTLIVVAGAVGSAIGLVPWYYAGKWYGRDRLLDFANEHGRLLTFSGEELDRAEEWFKKHGRKAVFFARLVPAVRALIAVPAAIMNMPLTTVLLYAFLGSLLYDGGVAFLGYSAGENAERYGSYIDWATYITVAIVVIWYLYRVVTFKKT